MWGRWDGSDADKACRDAAPVATCFRLKNKPTIAPLHKFRNIGNALPIAA
jgi:hypothetical protein